MKALNFLNGTGTEAAVRPKALEFLNGGGGGMDGMDRMDGMDGKGAEPAVWTDRFKRAGRDVLEYFAKGLQGARGFTEARGRAETRRQDALPEEERDYTGAQLTAAQGALAGWLGDKLDSAAKAIKTDPRLDKTWETRITDVAATTAAGIAPALLSPVEGALAFSSNLGEDMSQNARKAGVVKDPILASKLADGSANSEEKALAAKEIEDNADGARAFGNALGIAVSVAPLGKLHALMEGGVGRNAANAVRSLSTQVTDAGLRPLVANTLRSAVVKGAASGAVTGAAAAGALTVGENVGANRFAGEHRNIYDDLLPNMGFGAITGILVGGAASGKGYVNEQRGWEKLAWAYGSEVPGAPGVRAAVETYGKARTPENLANVFYETNKVVSKMPPSQREAVAQNLARKLGVTMPGAEPNPAGASQAAGAAAAKPTATQAEDEPAAQTEFESQVETAGAVQKGARTVVIGTKGQEVPAHWAWMPRGMIQASHSGEMMAANPAYPLTNTRDYSQPDEKDKALDTRNNWDPRRAVTDSPDAAVGPPIVARVIDENGQATLATAGGNNRQWAMHHLPAERWAATQLVQNSKAGQFGLEPTDDPEAQLTRFIGTFDFRKKGERERLQKLVDGLNPSPGMMQGTAKRAEIDVGAVPAEKLAGLDMDVAPADAQVFVKGLIADGTLDRNTMAPIASSRTQSQEYVHRLLVNAAFGHAAVSEARQDVRPTRAVMQGAIDAATPALLALRRKGGDAEADALAVAFTEALNYWGDAGADKLPGALQRTAEQTGTHALTQDLAGAMRRAVVTNERGKVQAEPTLEGLRGLFGGIKRAVDAHEGGADLFGNSRSLEETVRAGMESLRGGAEDAESEGVLAEREPQGRVPKVTKSAPVPEVVRMPVTKPVKPAGAVETGEPLPVRAEEPVGGNEEGALQVLNDKGDPYAPVKLEGLADIKIVQMPELVQLAADLMGALPELRKLPRARGHFVPVAGGRIVLDSRIFSNPVSAAKTMGHEFFHLVDYLPQQYLKRGNLWGRIHSLRQYMQERWTSGGPTNTELRSELIALSQHWKPWAMDGSNYDKYRRSGVELYADFGSVLLNSPATAKRLAPNFYREFFRGLDSKPEVRDAFFALQRWLNRPAMQILEDRSQKMRGWFGTAEEKFERAMKEQELRYRGYRGWLDRFKQGFFDVYSPIVSRAKGTPMETTVKFFFDQHPLAENLNYRLLERLHRTVVGPLEAAGHTVDELGEYLFFNRVLNERYEISRKLALEEHIETGGRSVIANPGGHTPETARAGLLRLRLIKGMRGMTILEASAQKFHDEVHGLMREAHSVGLLTDAQMTLIEGNRDNYATFTPLEYVDTYVPAGIAHQAGTFKEIANPYISTVLKMVTMTRAIELQKAKKLMVQVMEGYWPGEFERAQTRRDALGRETPMPPRVKGLRQIMLREHGKPAWVNVPAEIAEMFQRGDVPLLRSVMEVLGTPWRKIFYPLFITFNPLFQTIRHPVREARRSFRNAPDELRQISLGDTVVLGKNIFQRVRPELRAFIKEGEISPLIAEMLENFVITAPEMDFVAAHRSDAFGRILQQWHVLPKSERPAWLRSRVMKPAVQLFHWIEQTGHINMMLPRVGVYKALVNDLGWSRADASFYVRNYIGVPNHLKKGKYAWIANQVFPFVNVWSKGWVADFELASKGYTRASAPDEPGKSPASWWFRWAMTSGIWTMVKAAGSLGLLGVGAKWYFDRMSKHDKLNYDVVPLGELPGKEGGKALFLAMPQDQTDRLLSGLAYSFLMRAGLAAQGKPLDMGGAVTDLTQVGTSDMPGLNPLLKLAAAWKTYAQGQNPMDDFRGKPVLTNDEYLAGGLPALEKMIGWSYDQTGLQTFVKYNPNSDSTTETVLGRLPVVNGLLKVTDYGLRESQSEEKKILDAKSAKLRLSLDDATQQLLQEHGHLSSMRTQIRTPAQQARLQQLNGWYNTVYKPAEQEIMQIEDDGGRAPGIRAGLRAGSLRWK